MQPKRSVVLARTENDVYMAQSGKQTREHMAQVTKGILGATGLLQGLRGIVVLAHMYPNQTRGPLAGKLL